MAAGSSVDSPDAGVRLSTVRSKSARQNVVIMPRF